jgi:DNA-binding MarR family transcriptional regulator
MQAELVESLRVFRRSMVREGMLGAVRAFGGDDPSMTQVAALMLLDDGRARTVKELGDELGRSVSAASRLVDQLVRGGFVVRREDERDRRARRVALAEPGRAFLRALEERRAEAQLAVMARLTTTEQADVMRAMRLLAQAATRRSDDGDPDPDAHRP